MTLLAFAVQDAAWAASGTAPSQPAPVAPIAVRSSVAPFASDPAQLNLPLESVTLQEVHVGTNGKLIIHIQDAHANLSGQQALAKALDHLLTRYDLQVVLVEGGARDASLDNVRKLAPINEWKIIARRFLYDGIISGEEYLNLTTEHPMKILGVEYQDLYDDSIKAYAALVDRRKDILHYLYQSKTSLERLKNKFYPRILKDYETAKGASDVSGGADSTVDFKSGFSNLLDLAEKAQYPLADLPNVRNLKSLLDRERTIRFDHANAEQQKLLDALSASGAQAAAQSFVERSRRLKASQVSQYLLIRELFKTAQERRIALESLPELQAYEKYLSEFLDLQFDDLMSELERLEDGVYEKLLPTDDAKKVRAIDRFLGLLGNAYKLQMSSRDFGMFTFNEKDFATESWLAFLNQKLSELGFFESLVPTQPYLENARKDFGRFYELVGQRDHAFVENANRLMAEQKVNAAVLIAGGYHTAHLTELLRAEGTSYLVLAPAVTDVTDHEKYESLLLQRLKAQEKRLASNRRAEDTGTHRAQNVARTKIPRGLRAETGAARLARPGFVDTPAARFADGRMGEGFSKRVSEAAAGGGARLADASGEAESAKPAKAAETTPSLSRFARFKKWAAKWAAPAFVAGVSLAIGLWNPNYNGPMIDESFYAVARSVGNVFYITGDARLWPSVSEWAHTWGGIGAARGVAAVMIAASAGLAQQILLRFAQALNVKRPGSVAFWGALLFAISSPTLYIANIATYDPMAFFLYAAGLAALTRAARDDSPRWYAATAVLLSFSAMTRYFMAGPLILVPIVLWVVSRDRSPQTVSRPENPFKFLWLPMMGLLGGYALLEGYHVRDAIENASRTADLHPYSHGFMNATILMLQKVPAIVALGAVGFYSQWRSERFAQRKVGLLFLAAASSLVFVYHFRSGHSFTMEKNLAITAFFGAFFAGIGMDGLIGWIRKSVNRAAGWLAAGVLTAAIFFQGYRELQENRSHWFDYTPVVDATSQVVETYGLKPGQFQIYGIGQSGADANIWALYQKFGGDVVDEASPWRFATPEDTFQEARAKKVEIIVGPVSDLSRLLSGDTELGYHVEEIVRPENGPRQFIFVRDDLEPVGSESDAAARMASSGGIWASLKRLKHRSVIEPDKQLGRWIYGLSGVVIGVSIAAFLAAIIPTILGTVLAYQLGASIILALILPVFWIPVIHATILTFIAILFYDPAASKEPIEILPEEKLPFVTVVIPVRNEPADKVIRLLDSLAEADYPGYEVIVADNSDLLVDGQVNTDLVELLRYIRADKTKRVKFLRREKGDAVNPSAGLPEEFAGLKMLGDRKAGKSGNVNKAIENANPDYQHVLVTDADSVIGPKVLKEMVSVSERAKASGDPVGFVQSVFYSLNAQENSLTETLAAVNENFERSLLPLMAATGNVPNRGHGVLISREALAEVKNIPDHISEDLAFANALALSGKSFKNLLVVTQTGEEVPASWKSLRVQRKRWAKGTTLLFLEQMPKIWKSKLPLHRKLDLTLSMSSYLIVAVGSLWLPLALIVYGLGWYTAGVGQALLPFFTVYTLMTNLVMPIFTLKNILKLNWKEAARDFRLIPFASVAMAAITSESIIGVFAALKVRLVRSKQVLFEVTPKHRADPSYLTEYLTTNKMLLLLSAMYFVLSRQSTGLISLYAEYAVLVFVLAPFVEFVTSERIPATEKDVEEDAEEDSDWESGARMAQGDYTWDDLERRGYSLGEPDERITSDGEKIVMVQLLWNGWPVRGNSLMFTVDTQRNIFINFFYPEFPPLAEGEQRAGRGRALLVHLLDPKKYAGYEVFADASIDLQKSFLQLNDPDDPTRNFQPRAMISGENEFRRFLDKKLEEPNRKNLKISRRLELGSSKIHGIVPGKPAPSLEIPVRKPGFRAAVFDFFQKLNLKAGQWLGVYDARSFGHLFLKRIGRQKREIHLLDLGQSARTTYEDIRRFVDSIGSFEGYDFVTGPTGNAALQRLLEQYGFSEIPIVGLRMRFKRWSAGLTFRVYQWIGRYRGHSPEEVRFYRASYVDLRRAADAVAVTTEAGARMAGKLERFHWRAKLEPEDPQSKILPLPVTVRPARPADEENMPEFLRLRTRSESKSERARERLFILETQDEDNPQILAGIVLRPDFHDFETDVMRVIFLAARNYELERLSDHRGAGTVLMAAAASAAFELGAEEVKLLSGAPSRYEAELEWPYRFYDGIDMTYTDFGYFTGDRRWMTTLLTQSKARYAFEQTGGVRMADPSVDGLSAGYFSRRAVLRAGLAAGLGELWMGSSAKGEEIFRAPALSVSDETAAEAAAIVRQILEEAKTDPVAAWNHLNIVHDALGPEDLAALMQTLIREGAENELRSGLAELGTMLRLRGNMEGVEGLRFVSLLARVALTGDPATGRRLREAVMDAVGPLAEDRAIRPLAALAGSGAAQPLEHLIRGVVRAQMGDEAAQALSEAQVRFGSEALWQQVDGSVRRLSRLNPAGITEGLLENYALGFRTYLEHRTQAAVQAELGPYYRLLVAVEMLRRNPGDPRARILIASAIASAAGLPQSEAGLQMFENFLPVLRDLLDGRGIEDRTARLLVRTAVSAVVFHFGGPAATRIAGFVARTRVYGRAEDRLVQLITELWPRVTIADGHRIREALANLRGATARINDAVRRAAERVQVNHQERMKRLQGLAQSVLGGARLGELPVAETDLRWNADAIEKRDRKIAELIRDQFEAESAEQLLESYDEHRKYVHEYRRNLIRLPYFMEWVFSAANEQEPAAAAQSRIVFLRAGAEGLELVARIMARVRGDFDEKRIHNIWATMGQYEEIKSRPAQAARFLKHLSDEGVLASGTRRLVIADTDSRILTMGTEMIFYRTLLNPDAVRTANRKYKLKLETWNSGDGSPQARVMYMHLGENKMDFSPRPTPEEATRSFLKSEGIDPEDYLGRMQVRGYNQLPGGWRIQGLWSHIDVMTKTSNIRSALKMVGGRAVTVPAPTYNQSSAGREAVVRRAVQDAGLAVGILDYLEAQGYSVDSEFGRVEEALSQVLAAPPAARMASDDKARGRWTFSFMQLMGAVTAVSVGLAVYRMIRGNTPEVGWAVASWLSTLAGHGVFLLFFEEDSAGQKRVIHILKQVGLVFPVVVIGCGILSMLTGIDGLAILVFVSMLWAAKICMNLIFHGLDSSEDVLESEAPAVKPISPEKSEPRRESDPVVIPFDDELRSHDSAAPIDEFLSFAIRHLEDALANPDHAPSGEIKEMAQEVLGRLEAIRDAVSFGADDESRSTQELSEIDGALYRLINATAMEIPGWRRMMDPEVRSELLNAAAYLELEWFRRRYPSQPRERALTSHLSAYSVRSDIERLLRLGITSLAITTLIRSMSLLQVDSDAAEAVIAILATIRKYPSAFTVKREENQTLRVLISGFDHWAFTLQRTASGNYTVTANPRVQFLNFGEKPVLRPESAIIRSDAPVLHQRADVLFEQLSRWEPPGSRLASGPGGRPLIAKGLALPSQKVSESALSTVEGDLFRRALREAGRYPEKVGSLLAVGVGGARFAEATVTRAEARPEPLLEPTASRLAWIQPAAKELAETITGSLEERGVRLLAFIDVADDSGSGNLSDQNSDLVRQLNDRKDASGRPIVRAAVINRRGQPAGYEPHRQQIVDALKEGQYVLVAMSVARMEALYTWLLANGTGLDLDLLATRIVNVSVDAARPGETADFAGAFAWGGELAMLRSEKGWVRIEDVPGEIRALIPEAANRTQVLARTIQLPRRADDPAFYSDLRLLSLAAARLAEILGRMQVWNQAIQQSA